MASVKKLHFSDRWSKFVLWMPLVREVLEHDFASFIVRPLFFEEPFRPCVAPCRFLLNVGHGLGLVVCDVVHHQSPEHVAVLVAAAYKTLVHEADFANQIFAETEEREAVQTGKSKSLFNEVKQSVDVGRFRANFVAAEDDGLFILREDAVVDDF